MDNVEWVDLTSVQAMNLPGAKIVRITEFEEDFPSADISYADLEGIIKFLTKVRDSKGAK